MKTVSNNSKFIILSFLVASSYTSCTTSGPAGIFGKKSLHQQYEDKIKNAGLGETALGRKWLAAAEQSLASPLSVNIPYSETGYFPADEVKSAGVIFRGKRGEKLSIKLSKKPAAEFAIYVDLWQAASAGETKPKFLISADTLSTVTYEVERDDNYIVRLQPELLKGGEYSLSITTGPSLAFPVTPKAKSDIGSFWGVGRDGGARKHEGIDIFAPRRTALVAAADGTVTRVNENKLGGKVVFMTPFNKNYSLYYAHLDEQLVQPGQSVRTGDTLGLMGNTGNAKTTSPHLHFGIYTSEGAVDPLPFVNRTTKTPEKISVLISNLNNFVRNSKTLKLVGELPTNTSFTVEPNTLLKVEAASGIMYKVLLPGGEKGFVAGGSVTPAINPIRKVNIKNVLPLLDQPDYLAARKGTLAVGENIQILALYKDFYFVEDSHKDKGWIAKNEL